MYNIALVVGAMYVDLIHMAIVTKERRVERLYIYNL